MILASQQQAEKASQDQFGIKDMSEQISWPPELSIDKTEDKSHLKELVRKSIESHLWMLCCLSVLLFYEKDTNYSFLKYHY